MIVRSCDSSTIVAQVRGHACKDVEFHDERWPYDRANKAAIHGKVDDNIIDLIRAFAETCPEHAFATYDLTDIVHAGYYKPDDPIAELATQSLYRRISPPWENNYFDGRQMDRRILEDSFRLL